jgi:hypothetical protein
MDEMRAPEQRDLMHQAVYQVGGGVECNQRQDE